MADKNTKVSKLNKSRQRHIYNDVLSYAKKLGYPDKECKEMAEHAMTLTLFELSESIDIRKYL